jgi:hypothetical protein
VTAGTGDKMLEYVLETRVDCAATSDIDSVGDTLLDDFLLTHSLFMDTNTLSQRLLDYYQYGSSVKDNLYGALHSFDQQRADAQVQQLLCKRRVVHVVHRWTSVYGLHWFLDPVLSAFTEVRPYTLPIFNMYSTRNYTPVLSAKHARARRRCWCLSNS